MSNIYIQEPPTNGKVLLKTSVGDIDVELWSKEAPKACRNFVQLCMEHYYDNTIFHRIVKGFIIQGGDPTGTGHGGESIYGKPFKDEFHQRLRFNRRGLVAMANSGPNDNSSQFFFTLDRADELNKKHTIFGKVGGNTIYNMIRMVDLEVDEDDRPLEPPKIHKAEILYNPFDDIEARGVQRNEKKEKKSEKEKSKKVPKNFKLLSFGEEAEEDDMETTEISKKITIKSSHDLLKDPKLSSEPAIDTSESKPRDEDDVTQLVRDKLKKESAGRKRRHDDGDDDDDNEEEREKKQRRKKLQEEARKIKRELAEQKSKKENHETDRKRHQVHDDDNDVGHGVEKEETNELMKQLKEERKQFIRKKKENVMLKKGGSRETETLALLSRFQDELFEQQEDPIHAKETDDNDDDGGDETTENDQGWMHHKLTFKESDAKAKDASIQDEDTYDIYDPRNPINKRRVEASKQKKQEKKRR
eukprot:gene7940-8795_t